MTVIYYKSVSSGFLEETLNKNIMHKAYHLYLCCVCIFWLNETSLYPLQSVLNRTKPEPIPRLHGFYFAKPLLNVQ